MTRKNLRDVNWSDRDSARSFSTGKYFGEVDDFSDWRGSHKGSYKPKPSCYESHKPLALPGTDFVIHGGSCIQPAVKDADVYIGFDHGMTFSTKHWPWMEGVEIQFLITDMGVPTNVKDFNKLIEYTRQALEAGKKVHCGCIGGHGRTGTFFSALVASYGEKDATSYVRKHYCSKAVESNAQVQWLEKHFGVTSRVPAKAAPKAATKKPSQSVSTGLQVYAPLPDRGSIFD